MIYAERLKNIRIDNDLKQKEIAKILHKSQQGYAHLENGYSKFTIDDIILLCHFYNISPSYILGFTDEQITLDQVRNLKAEN